MLSSRFLVVFGGILLLVSGGQADNFMPCDSEVYCYGDIIHTVNQARVFPDSKTFVDRPMKYEPHIVQSNYKFMIDRHGLVPPKEEVEKFLEHNFHPTGYEFQPWVPQDWTADPPLLGKIADDKLKTYASELNSFWKELGRQIRPDVSKRPDMYSMIYVDNPVVVPGGRFTEFYYWDQFWILKGLLHSEMTATVQGMLENFFQMVEQIGYIPNGGRIYYRRSHPPLLIPMVKDFMDKTNNVTFLENNILTLQQEFDFWMENRTTEVTIGQETFTVARYFVDLGNPRPESYWPDYELVSELPNVEDQTALYADLKTAAESGIDFSFRWFLPENKSDVGTMKDTKTRQIIPVDLNVLILRNAKLMEGFYTQLQDEDAAAKFADIAAEWERAINAVFWNEEEGSWFDYVIEPSNIGHKKEFFPGNILPLILGTPSMTEKTPKVLAYLKKEGVLNYPGGIPASLEPTKQQWDFPNAWAPHNHWFIESLENSGNEEARKFAAETAQKWISNNYLTYRTHNNTMFEKYDASQPGNYGSGGEYEVVIGFGWSNGVVLDLLNKYGKDLVAPLLPDEGGNGGLNIRLSQAIVSLGVALLVFGKIA